MDSYYSKVLYPFVESLIKENKKATSDGYYLSVDDLTDDDQYLFASYLIEYDDRDLSSSINENDKYDDIVCSLLNLLKQNDLDSRLDFADTVKERVVSHYKTKMQGMIDDLIGIVEREDKYPNFPWRDRESAEVQWRSL